MPYAYECSGITEDQSEKLKKWQLEKAIFQELQHFKAAIKEDPYPGWTFYRRSHDRIIEIQKWKQTRR
jgi:hypothetical protein